VFAHCKIFTLTTFASHPLTVFLYKYTATFNDRLNTKIMVRVPGFQHSTVLYTEYQTPVLGDDET